MKNNSYIDGPGHSVENFRRILQTKGKMFISFNRTFYNSSNVSSTLVSPVLVLGLGSRGLVVRSVLVLRCALVV